jgi:5'-nucleotidase
MWAILATRAVRAFGPTIWRGSGYHPPAVRILLTNDDGIRADGLGMLAARLKDLGELYVVAPDRERSCIGHAFTLFDPLRVEEVAPRWFSVSGTPADCVYLGVLELCPRPDLVVSGINHGYNLGADIFYSGTVAGAIEAALRGVPAIAVSMGWQPGVSFEPAARLCRAVVQQVLREGLPRETLLNINVPGPAHRRPTAASSSATGPEASAAAGDAKPDDEPTFAWTRLGQRLYREHVESRRDPRGSTYYWIGGPPAPVDEPQGTDLHAVHTGIASITPLGLDLTHGGLLEKLKSWNVEGYRPVRD